MTTANTSNNPLKIKNFIKFWLFFIFTAGVFGVVVGYFTGCVTVNVNFPESAVQSASDDYVKELYRTKEKSKLNTPGSPAVEVKPKTSFTPSFEFISSAHAEMNLKFDSPKEKDLQSKLAGTLGEVDQEKSKSNLGENNKGYLEVKTDKPLLQKKLESLVSKVNGWRKELYQEALKHPGMSQYKLQDIEENFSRSFRSQSPGGTWVQNPDGQWMKK